MTKPSYKSGFTIIELMVVVVILCILAALIGLTASGVQAKNRNSDRQADIDALRGQLESYYAANDKYPAFSNLGDATWRAKNMSKLKDSSIDDPRWNKDITACTKNGKPTIASEPVANCYSYQVTSPDSSKCDNVNTPCVHYTLTAILEGGEKYVKSSLN